MARIPTYQKDIYISDLDRIIGTDGDTNELVTKNFFLGDIAEYVIDKFIDPDAVSFTIPVLRDTQDTLGANATRITGSIMSQDINPDGTKITIAGLLQVDKEAKIKGKLTEGVAESGQLILNSSLNATGITIKAPAHADLPASYIMELPNDIGVAGSQLTTDGIGKVYWADPEDDDLTVTGDFGTGTIDLDTQSLNIIGGDNVSTTMLNQTLTINASGFVTGSGTPYKLALWDQTDNLTDSLISQGSPSAGSLVEINSPQVVIGTNNATPYDQKLIGEGIDVLNESLITSLTNVVLGEGSYGGVQGRKYYKDNTVMLDRVLKMGSAQVPENSVYNTIPTIHMGDPAWVRSNPFTNYSGIQGFFPTMSTGGTLFSNRFLYVSSINVNTDGFNNTHADGARYQMMFDPQFGTDSGGTGLGDVFGTESQANCSAGMVEYRTASQNYDYSTGAQSTPGSQGIFTFDARYNSSNDTAVAGTSLFLLKSGYGQRKFEIKQNAGGSSNPGAALIFGKGAASTSESSVAMGNAVTASGLYSFASGDTTTASGISSFASGKNTTTTVEGGAVFGKYNLTTNELFVVGNGDNSQGSDLIVGKSDGVILAPSLDINEILDPKCLITLEYLQQSTVSGTGQTNFLPIWSDGPNGVLGDSVLSQETGTAYGTTKNLVVGGNIYQSNMGNSVSIGENALANGVAGTNAENVAIGPGALTSLTTATNNIGIGAYTLQNTNSNNNIAIGKNSQIGQTTGLGNISLGFNSLSGNNVGSTNVVIGHTAVQNVGTGAQGITGNVILGTGAVNATTITGGLLNNVIIGSDALEGAGASNISNAVFIGNGAGRFVGTNAASDIGIGYSAFYGNNNGFDSAGENIAIGANANGSNSQTGVKRSIKIGSDAGTAGSYAVNISAVDTNNYGVNYVLGDHAATIGGANNSITNAQAAFTGGGRNNTIASGATGGAILGGYDNTVNGAGSAGMALGSNLEVSGANQVVLGRFNVANNNSKLIVGAGFSNANRINAFEVKNTSQLKLGKYGGTQFLQSGSLYNLLTVGNQGNVNEIPVSDLSPQILEASSYTVIPNDVVNLPADSSTRLVKISWGSVNNGTMTLRLPAISSFSNRTIQIITDGTFDVGAGKKVNIEGSFGAGDTIDGVGQFELSKKYEGVTLWSDGTEWFIIQAKAH
jgi:hypothetical protein